VVGPYPDVNTFLPREGLGYKTYSRDECRWGKASTIKAPETIARKWYTKYPNTPIYIGNISRKGGGDLPPHKSHKTGIDVDIKPFHSENNALPVTWMDKGYDQKKTKELIELIISSYRIQYIFFNDPELIKKKLCTYWVGHDNHLHIRFDFLIESLILMFSELLSSTQK
jgi:conjugal transfer mating pair stabilization protein TraG